MTRLRVAAMSRVRAAGWPPATLSAKSGLATGSVQEISMVVARSFVAWSTTSTTNAAAIRRIGCTLRRVAPDLIGRAPTLPVITT